MPENKTKFSSYSRQQYYTVKNSVWDKWLKQNEMSGWNWKQNPDKFLVLFPVSQAAVATFTFLQSTQTPPLTDF